MRTFLLKTALLLSGLLTVLLMHAQVASFTINGTNGFCKGTTVTFTNTGSGATSFSWDFGDGNQSTQTSPAHVYAQPGTYLVSLTAFNGATSQSIQKAIYIRDYPSASFNLSTGGFSGNLLPGQPIKPINFSNGSLGYYWNNGAGFISTQEHVTFSYSTPGNYTLSLTTHNGCGDSSTYTQNVNVIDTNNYTPQASGYVSPLILCPGASIQLNNYTGTYTAFKWIMGDGSTFENQESFNYTYSHKGKYKVALVAYYKSKSDTSFFDVTVTDSVLDKSAVYVNIQPQQYDPNTSSIRYLTCIGSPFSFTGAYSADIVKHFWRLPNGVVLSARDTQYAFNATGDYPLVYSFENKCGVKDSISYLLSVRTVDSIPPDYITMYVNAGPLGTICPGNKAYFSTYGSDAAAIKWVFHDGAVVVNSFEASRVYNTPGTYDVKLIVQSGCRKDTLVRTVNVSGAAESVSDFNIINSYNAATPLCVGDSIYALADSNASQTYKSVTIAQHNWYMGDGAVYHTALAAHHYNTAGWYSIVHETVNSCGQKSVTARTVWVNSNAVPVANFYLPQQSSCVFDSVMIDQFSSKSDSIIIWMGDGNRLYLNRNNFFPHLWYVYKTPGKYKVTLYAYNKCGVDSAFDQIAVYALPDAAILLSDTIVKTGVTLNIGATINGNVKHIWRYGHALSDTSSATTLSRIFNAEGIYTIYLETMNENGCSGLDSVKITVSNHASLPEQVGMGMQVRVYPNPAASKLMVDVTSVEATDCQIGIFDLDGRLKLAHTEKVGAGASILTFPVESLNAGIYLIRIQTTRGIRTLKFIKQ